MRIRGVWRHDLPYLKAWAPYSAWEALGPEDQAKARPDLVARSALSTLQSVLSGPERGFGLVAEDGGQRLGYVLGLVAPDSTTGETGGLLVDLYVVPAARRRGVGRALQQAALAQFARLGLRKVKMVSDLQNLPALRLAQTAGFGPEGLIGVKEWPA